jgi:hypothetical protein
MNDDALSGMISENARLVGELERTKDLLKIVSGEHDAAIRKDERERALEALIPHPVSTPPEGTAPDSICPKHSYCRVNNGNPEAIMHFCDGIPIEKRGKMVQALEQLIFAMHCYEQDVLDTDFPPPSKHRDMVDQAEELFVTLEEKERWLYRHDTAIAQAAREKALDELRGCYIQAFDDPNVSEHQKETFRTIDVWIESLRQPKQEQKP